MNAVVVLLLYSRKRRAFTPAVRVKTTWKSTIPSPLPRTKSQQRFSWRGRQDRFASMDIELLMLAEVSNQRGRRYYAGSHSHPLFPAIC